MFWGIVLSLLAVPRADAERRVALAVGNSAYLHAAELANPLHDAEDVAAALRTLGFEVLLGTDLGKRAFDEKVRAFAERLEGADVGVFFYAGHGLQAKGRNYLIPVDARLSAERDLDFQTVALEFVLAQMEREARTSIVFLDACRNNPLARSLARTMGTRGGGENAGLAPVAGGFGSFIAFATQPGNVASDGAGRNSPFTAALGKHIATPGLSLSDLMIEVRNDVAAATEGAQVPWDHSALRSRFTFKPGAPAPDAAPPPQLSEAAEAWMATKDTTSRAVLEAFMTGYRGTAFEQLARARLAEISGGAGAPAPRPFPRPSAPPLPDSSDLPATEDRSARPSFDCATSRAPAEAAICASPVLAALDAGLARRYAAASEAQDAAGRAALLAGQQRWLALRNACGADEDCLEEQYRVRIGQLGEWPGAKPAGRPGPGGKPVSPAVHPSFDCAMDLKESEQTICASPALSLLDNELDRLYVRTNARLSPARRQQLVVEQRAWIARRNICAADLACLNAQYLVRIERLRGWR